MSQVYQSNFGAWYARVQIDGEVIELKFDHQPDEQEITDAQQRVIDTRQSVIEVEAENGAVIE